METENQEVQDFSPLQDKELIAIENILEAISHIRMHEDKVRIMAYVLGRLNIKGMPQISGRVS